MRSLRPPRTLLKYFARALLDHGMIEAGDRIIVALSGGKDSWALLGLLADLKGRCPVPFEISAAFLDAGGPQTDTRPLAEACGFLDIPLRIERQDIFSAVAARRDEGSSFCGLCSRLRRGALYRIARESASTKLALGHHLDDAIETLALNLFYGGRTAALPPVLLSNAGNVPLIRPLLHCAEADLAAYADSVGFPIIPSACPMNEDGSVFARERPSRRKQVKTWLRLVEDVNPRFRDSARRALGNLRPERFADTRFGPAF